MTAIALPAEASAWLVGGAVRDRLLGLPAGDRDWVVVGTTADAMAAQGFRAVGRDFPVFLHPQSGEEYALARTERKTARGHRGFVVQADPSVTLDEDLRRRDFTINAIAEAADGSLHDPLGGLADLRSRVLRHCGPAFAEDPLRVLRAARFLARLAPLGFTLAEDTLELMRGMVAHGELADLTPERVWKELERALASPRPSAFLETLRHCGALAVVLPEVDALYGVPQRAEFHPEIDTGVHTGMVCDMAARIAPGDAVIGFAALTHDLGKALTPREEWPRHIAHESRGLVPLAAVCDRLRVGTTVRDLARLACAEHLNVHRFDELRDDTLLALLERCDAFRQPDRVAGLAKVCEADKRGRLGHSESDYPQGRALLGALAAARGVRARDLLARQPGLAGAALGDALRDARRSAIAVWRRSDHPV